MGNFTELYLAGERLLKDMRKSGRPIEAHMAYLETLSEECENQIEQARLFSHLDELDLLLNFKINILEKIKDIMKSTLGGKDTTPQTEPAAPQPTHPLYLRNATPGEFINWLNNYHSNIHTVPTETGYYTLSQVQDYPNGIIRRIEIRFNWHSPSTIYPDVWGIYFEILEVGDRLKVTPHESDPVFRPWLAALLVELLADYPQEQTPYQAAQPKPPLAWVKKQPSGRPHLQEDIWAWQEVNEKGINPQNVYQEWMTKAEHRNLVDPLRQFKRITSPEWLK